MRTMIAWYGDMNLASHYNVIGRRRRLHATIVLDEAIPPGMFPNRKALAAALEAMAMFHGMGPPSTAKREHAFVA